MRSTKIGQKRKTVLKKIRIAGFPHEIIIQPGHGLSWLKAIQPELELRSGKLYQTALDAFHKMKEGQGEEPIPMSDAWVADDLAAVPEIISAVPLPEDHFIPWEDQLHCLSQGYAPDGSEDPYFEDFNGAF
jgi:hypothetical protein